MVSEEFLGTAPFTDAPAVKNGLCVICKGSRNLCGRSRCPLMARF